MKKFSLAILIICNLAVSAQKTARVKYTLSVKEPASKMIHITGVFPVKPGTIINFKMPQWTPGYYQIMNYGSYVRNLKITNRDKQDLQIKTSNGYTWSINSGKSNELVLDYDVVTDRSFVASSITDSFHSYITPAGAFMHVEGQLATPVALKIDPAPGWNRVACGLDSVPGEGFNYLAPDFDFLYDCPILMGNLEELPPFTVNGIKHRFIGYKIGELDRAAFISDLKKVVQAGVDIIKDIPYKQYTFLAIGPGNGGIEHLTSTAVSFGGSMYRNAENKKRTLSFLAHEYFHHYNVKRIRPIELGPFNYDSGSRTKQLWISEGLTVYYEYIMLRRAGLINDADMYSFLRNNIRAYENQPGRLFQSLSQASEETWADGPFGRKGDLVNKTISYYEKGPVVGLMLDFAIRHHTKNKKSLDDLMRKLYKEYYKKKKRGFTEAEMRKAAEDIAGVQLPEIFEYVYTTKEPDYAKYFGYAGLTIDTVSTSGSKSERSFLISPLANPDPLQSEILKGWMQGN